MVWALDYLGGAKYGSIILKKHPSGWKAGFFSNTFGDALPVVESLVHTGTCPGVRLHLMWSDTHSYSEKDIPSIVKEAKRVLPIVLRHPEIEWRISPCCEHNMPYSSIRKVFDAIALVFTDKVVYVNSPMKGAIVPECVNELHGTSVHSIPGRVDYSFDGNGCTDADVETMKSRFSSAETFYFWHSRFNGRWGDNDATPRPQRHGWPDSNTIDSVVYLSTDKGQTALPNNWLYKSDSENKGTGDPRASKPVFIIPVKDVQVVLKTQAGQNVDVLKFYGNYIDGRYRYYSSQYGFQIAQRAISFQGHANCDVWTHGKKWGVINPGFRDTTFR